MPPSQCVLSQHFFCPCSRPFVEKWLTKQIWDHIPRIKPYHAQHLGSPLWFSSKQVSIGRGIAERSNRSRAMNHNGTDPRMPERSWSSDLLKVHRCTKSSWPSSLICLFLLCRVRPLSNAAQVCIVFFYSLALTSLFHSVVLLTPLKPARRAAAPRRLQSGVPFVGTALWNLKGCQPLPALLFLHPCMSLLLLLPGFIVWEGRELWGESQVWKCLQKHGCPVFLLWQSGAPWLLQTSGTRELFLFPSTLFLLQTQFSGVKMEISFTVCVGVHWWIRLHRDFVTFSVVPMWAINRRRNICLLPLHHHRAPGRDFSSREKRVQKAASF